MLFLFYGTDQIKVRETAFLVVREKEAGGAAVTYIDSDTFAPGVFSDAAGATSLFGGEELYVIDTPSSKAEFEEEVLESLDALKESSNTFVLIEGALLAAQKKKYEKCAESIEEFKGEKAERFDIFSLADLLSRKDKRNLWVKLVDARAAGISTEEIIGILWWQLKALRLAATTRSASEAGMKDFPYNKSKRALGNFRDGELESLSYSLIALRHDGHLGKCDIDLALEKWVLTL